MTELHIDKQPVVLPENFSFELIQENPFFTKNGKYTLDVELSLDDPQNARLYKHLNRIHNKIAVPENRSAYLVVDNIVILNGTEIIIEITDNSVKIQLVSGESELNFLVGGDRKINTLDLGSVDDDPQYTPDNFVFTHIDAKVIWVPVFSSNEKKIINDYVIWLYDSIIQYGQVNPDTYVHLRKFLPQPFLYHIVNKIIESLGYTIDYNFFEQHSSYKWLYIVNGIHTKKYNKMLPDWTVNEFFEEIEKLFNVIISISDAKKTVKISSRNSFFEQNQKTVINDSFDHFVNTIENEQRMDYFNSNVGYELPDDEYFRFQNIDEKIIRMARKEDIGYFDKLFQLIGLSSDKPSLKNTLYNGTLDKQQYICAEQEYEIDGNTVFCPKKVNVFQPLMNNPNSNDINVNFRITPAPMINVFLKIQTLVFESPYSPYEGNSQEYIYDKYEVAIQIPITATSKYTLEKQDNPVSGWGGSFQFLFDDSNTYFDEEDYVDFDIQNKIEGSENESDILPDKIQLAFFMNMRYATQNTFMKYYSQNKKVLYPISFTDTTWDFLPDELRAAGPGTLRLASGNLSLSELNYNKSMSIDTSQEFIIKFSNQKMLDAKNLFVINNKNFACKQLKYTITSNGFGKIIEGTFYAVT